MVEVALKISAIVVTIAAAALVLRGHFRYHFSSFFADFSLIALLLWGAFMVSRSLVSTLRSNPAADAHPFWKRAEIVILLLLAVVSVIAFRFSPLG